MEKKLIDDLEEQLDDVDIESIKLDAVIQLKTWQKKMFALIEKTYATRLSEIDEIVLNLSNEIEEKQNQLEEQADIHDRSVLLNLEEEIDQLKADIIVKSSIPENFQQVIERTIRIKNDNDEEEEENDDLVIINIVKGQEITGEQMAVVLPATNVDSRISRIFNSGPVQQALTSTLTQMGTLAATSTTTIAATSMAKTALLTTACGLGTVAYGMGKLAMGTTQKVWSYVSSPDT